jgi:phenylacetate-CoA ligase
MKVFSGTSVARQKREASAFFKALSTKKVSFWQSLEEENMVTTYVEAKESVEAYKHFLKKQKIFAKKVTSREAFSQVPKVTKKNYLRAYPWVDLLKKDITVDTQLTMTATSGSTGKPFYFPRTQAVDIQSSLYHELFLRLSNIEEGKSILLINCFAMGVWIGGVLTYQAATYIGARGYPITIITPGINKREIFEALRTLAPEFDQIILTGYPPFIKDLVDDAQHEGIILSKLNLRIIFAAESFSESFRDYIAKKAGIQNIYRDMMNIYGSADLGTMAQETPLCILVRRLALTNSSLYKRIFGQSVRLPTLAQYVPSFVSFEVVNGTVLCTGNNALPLVRYEIGDTGMKWEYSELVNLFNEEGVNLSKECTRVGIEDTLMELPFICVYERADLSTTLYGILIYPEYVKRALQQEDLETYVTGKFTMLTKNDEREDQYLEINIELQQGKIVSSSLEEMLTRAVYGALLTQSAEYRKLSEELREKIYPKVVLWPHGDIRYFGGGGKQKWVTKG